MAVGLVLNAWLFLLPGLARAALSTPTLTATASPAAVTLATTSPTLTDTAVLSGGNHPTGTITFTLFDQGSMVDIETVAIAGDGTYTTPTGYTLPATGATVTGVYEWDVTYNGDVNNNSVSSPDSVSSQTAVSAAHPLLSTSADPASVTLGGGAPVTLRDSASLAGGYFESGALTFTLVHQGVTLDTETVAVGGNGTYTTPTGYTLPSSGQITGSYQWNVTYLGDANNTAIAQVNLPAQLVAVHVQPALSGTPLLTAVTLSPAPSTLTDSAELSGGISPSGTLTFTLFRGTTLVDTETTAVSGNGVYTTPTGYTIPATRATVTGVYQWVVSYSGDVNDNAVLDANAADERVVVTAATPALSVQAPPAVSGTPVAGSAVSGTLSAGAAPGGALSFVVFGPQPAPPTSCAAGGRTVGQAAVSGNGTYHPGAAFTPTAVGDYWWYARYRGDGNNNSAASACGAGMPETSVRSLPPPVLSGLKLAPRSFPLAGRMVRRACVRRTSRNSHRPACTRTVTLTVRYRLSAAARVTFRILSNRRKAGGRWVVKARAGADRLVIRRRLRPGSYVLTATPAGGAARRVSFRVVSVTGP